jgi:hypothetical protein
MKKQKLVKALLYRAQICDSILEHVHGMQYWISEIFVPKAKMCINEKGYAFIQDKPRNDKVVEIKISQKLISDAKKLISIEKKTKSGIEKLFSETLVEKIDNLKKQQPPDIVEDIRIEADKMAERQNQERNTISVSSGVIEMNKRGMDNPAALT